MHTLIKNSGTSLRIIAEELHGHWSARFADPSANETYGGADAMDAIRRLIENSPQWGVTIHDFEPDWDNCSSTRIEIVFVGHSCGD